MQLKGELDAAKVFDSSKVLGADLIYYLEETGAALHPSYMYLYRYSYETDTIKYLV